MNAKRVPDSEIVAPERSHAVRLAKVRVAFVSAGVLAAMLLSVMSQTSIYTAMPHIVADLGGFDRYAWAAIAYLAAAEVAAAISGRLSDVYGRGTFFILGLAVVIVGAALAGLSPALTS